VEDEDVLGVGFVDEDGNKVTSDNGDKVGKKEFGDGFFEEGEAVFDLIEKEEEEGEGKDNVIKSDGNVGAGN